MKTLLYFFTSVLFLLSSCNFIQAQYVGIGTATPLFPADITDSTSGTAMRLRTVSNTTGDRTLLRFTTSVSGSSNGFNSSYIGNLRLADGTALLFGTASSGSLAPGERMRLNEDGFLAIGTQNPLARLHIDMSNISNNSTAMIINDDDDPIVYFQRNNANRGFLQQLGNDFKVGTTTDNNTGNFIVRTNGTDRAWFTPTGRLGIGTANPLTQLHMTGELTMQNNNPIIQMQNAAGENKSFIQTIADDMLIGTNSVNPTGNFIVRTNGANKVIVNPSGYVGIGTTPSVPLHLEGGNSPTAMTINSDANSTDFAEFRKANVSKGYIRGILSDLEMGTYGSNNNGDLVLSTREIGRLIVHSNGRIGLNTSYNNAGFQLAVLGNIICTDITTAPFSDWPDYVFTKQYKLKPLREVENFIQNNNYLPGIPSAKEIGQKGIQLGDMQKRMMEKIEELTLYIIELDKKNEALRKEIIKLKKVKSNYSKNIIYY